MTLIAAVALIVGAVVFVLLIRSKDVPEPPPVSPFHHLDEKKVAIYENLRDLQFEYRVGKLSDEDYQTAKKGLQRELAQVMADIDKLKQDLGVEAAPVSTKPKAIEGAFACQHCGAKFDRALKFCGECGKAMTGGAA